MDHNHLLLIILLILSETMGAIPEEYVKINGFLDIVCKAIKQALKKPDVCQENDIELSRIS